MACIRKIAASVLLKLFINGNEKCHSIDPPPSALAKFYFQHTFLDPTGLEKYN